MSHPIPALALACLTFTPVQTSGAQPPPVRRGYTIPLIDLADQRHRQIIVAGREGQYRVRLMDNHKAADCAYPGVEVLPEGTFAATTYGHWTEGEQPYIVSVRFTLAEFDELARARPKPARASTSEGMTITVADTDHLRRGQCIHDER